MKFFPENKKKTIIFLAILLLAVGGIVYLNFFAGRAGEAPLPLPSAGRQASVSTGGLLPYGSKIDDQILRDQNFLILKPGPKVEVDLSELGQPDLFGAPTRK